MFWFQSARPEHRLFGLYGVLAIVFNFWASLRRNIFGGHSFGRVNVKKHNKYIIFCLFFQKWPNVCEIYDRVFFIQLYYQCVYLAFTCIMCISICLNISKLFMKIVFFKHDFSKRKYKNMIFLEGQFVMTSVPPN